MNRKSINLKWPLRSDNESYFSKNKTTLSAIREVIKVLLLTKKGERVINPDIGTNIPILTGQLFENIDKVGMRMQLEAEISNAFKSFLDGIELVGLEVETQDENPELRLNDLLVKLSYKINNIENFNDRVQFKISG